MSQILDKLYLGSYSDAKNEKWLTTIGITHIVTVGAELKTVYPGLFKYLYIPAYDSPEYKLITYFDEIADFIDKAIEKEKGKVFVHCYWGISRSTTSVLTYLIKYHKMTPSQGRAFIKKRRDIICPNNGFMKQLETYAKKIVVELEPEKETPKLMYGSSTLTRILTQNKTANKQNQKSTVSNQSSMVESNLIIVPKSGESNKGPLIEFKSRQNAKSFSQNASLVLNVNTFEPSKDLKNFSKQYMPPLVSQGKTKLPGSLF